MSPDAALKMNYLCLPSKKMNYRRWATSNIQIIDQSGIKPVDTTFTEQVKQVSGEKLDRCYQCFTCSLGCPVSPEMDYHPDQIIRMVQLGLKERVLNSSAIWICLGCETCVARCPNEIDILRVMDTLREIALEERIKGKEKIIPTFHRAFLYPIKVLGKQYELGLIVYLMLKTRDFFGDLILGIRMILKRKLPFIPSRIKGVKQVKEIFIKTGGIPGGGKG
jgi:heterodisulfide reductase subunit C